jgi:acyl transferase domain-containing protein/acyl carrier protein
MADFLTRARQLSPERLALLAYELQRQLDETAAQLAQAQARARYAAEPLAVIGAACRFPGGINTPEQLWDALAGGVDLTSEIGPERWPANRGAGFDPRVARGSFFADVAGFDAEFFGISSSEAGAMDPQQRLLLEVAWEAFESGGRAPASQSGSPTGVFIGMSNVDYSRQLLGGPLDQIGLYDLMGVLPSVVAGRISYALGLQGPSLVVDTACSASLVAVHLAGQSLRAGECDLAIVGGVNLILGPEVGISAARAGGLAADGRCKAFDAAADGIGRGEGAVVILLRRLSDARAAGDRILAVIHGSAINQDGRSNGLSAPNGLAQQAVIREALRRAGVDPREVKLLEAHGTGTALGDPIEIQAAGAVLAADRSSANPLLVGSIKSNLGHTEAAAGLAGLLKAVLACQHGAIPGNLHFRQPNPLIPWSELAIGVPTSLTPWPPGRRIAGVSSFGVSGTNAHVILEESPAPVDEPPDGPVRPGQLLLLTARSPERLTRLASAHADHLATLPEASLADFCWTVNIGGANLPHRLAVWGTTVDEVRQRLAAAAGSARAPGTARGIVDSETRPRVAFLFSGAGSQSAGMGRQLYETQPIFRDTLRRAEADLFPLLQRSLLAALYGTGPEHDQLTEPIVSLPALVVVQLGLVDLWRAWGVTPDAVLGHSTGEIAAAYAAGALGFEDALALAARRASLFQELPADGGMANVYAGEAEVRDALGALGREVSIAAINAPRLVTISGASEPLQTGLARLQQAGHRVELLPISRAAHAPPVDPILDRLEQSANALRFGTPAVPFVSGLLGRPVAAAELSQGVYWRRQAREPVRFADGLRALDAQGCRVFLEIGGQAQLSALGHHGLPGAGYHWLPSLRAGHADWEPLLATTGRLAVLGVPVDLAAFDRPYRRQRQALPRTPFQHQRFWTDRRVPVPLPPSPRGEGTPDWLYRVTWRPLPPVSENISTVGRWLILADRSGVGPALAAELRRLGGEASLVFADPGAGAAGSALAPGRSAGWATRLGPAAEVVAGVVYLWGLDSAGQPSDWATGLQRNLLDLVELVNALPSFGRPPRLWTVTRGAQSVTGLDGVSPAGPAQAALWGLGATIAIERPELQLRRLDVDSRDPEEAARLIVGEVLAPDREDQVAYRTGQRYGARLARVGLPAEPARPRALEPEASYLISGGLGGIGLVTARWLVERGARSLVLLGRRPPSPEALPALNALRALGARVETVQADVGNREQLAEVLANLRRGLPPLRGIIHAAAVFDDAPLRELSGERIAAILQPKVAGAVNLHELTRDLALDFFILFSSGASLLGLSGFGAYAAANAYLDGFARRLRSEGRAAVSVNWGAWGEAGAFSLRGPDAQRRYREHGIGALSSDEALQLLTTLLERPPSQIAAFRYAWDRYAALFSEPLPAFFDDVRERGTAIPDPAEPTSTSPALPTEWLAANPEERYRIVVDHLIGQVQLVADGARGVAITPQTAFAQLGMDSLMAVELRNRLQETFARPFPLTLGADYPTIDALARYLLQVSSPGPARPDGSPALSQPKRTRSETEPTKRSGWLGRLRGRPGPGAEQ